ncbi:structural maintenance of chromosomes protein 4 [Iris pallida]|uniref:Structural maintenance of chromosomes protein 4 n=1 Tax=Iris pallida TaxID=29817 RepID=A0AAX6GJ45_IRIPA|nr:structural maintenance of chromosomes protein 4 [Iris pallida]
MCFLIQNFRLKFTEDLVKFSSMVSLFKFFCRQPILTGKQWWYFPHLKLEVFHIQQAYKVKLISRYKNTMVVVPTFEDGTIIHKDYVSKKYQTLHIHHKISVFCCIGKVSDTTHTPQNICVLVSFNYLSNIASHFMNGFILNAHICNSCLL